MANKDVFGSAGRGMLVAQADTTNNAGGRAYSLSDKEALAQYAVTGTFGNTYYTNAQDEVKRITDLVQVIVKDDPEFVARLAVYARRSAWMKDTPAFMVAALAANKQTELMSQVFPLVIDNGKMLRNFVQIIRSGVLGRKSLGTAPKRAIQRWFANRSDSQVFFASVGNDPSLADVIKLSRPKPEGESRNALIAYLLGKEHNVDALPEIVKAFEAFKLSGGEAEAPSVPFQMLTGLPLNKDHWIKIARDARYLMTIKNLNTFQRHGVFEDKEVCQLIVDRIRNAEDIRKARVFPYQLMSAYVFSKGSVPEEIVDALHDAMEIATENVPQFEGKTLIAVDVSGSMSCSVTGGWGSVSSKIRCVDAAALFGSAVLRRNPGSKLIAVDTRLHTPRMSGRDTVLTTAGNLAKFGGGGTNLSLVGEYLNKSNEKYDNVIVISDNESWADRGYYRGTGLQKQFNKYRAKHNNSKLVCIDIVPYGTSQAKTGSHVLNVGGFNDQVFSVVANFLGGSDGEAFIEKIMQTSIE